MFDYLRKVTDGIKQPKQTKTCPLGSGLRTALAQQHFGLCMSVVEMSRILHSQT